MMYFCHLILIVSLIVMIAYPKKMPLYAEMPTIPFFAESFRFWRPISALRFWTSKFCKIAILQAKMVPDKIKDVTLTYTPVLRTFYVAVDNYTWSPVVNKWLVCVLFCIGKSFLKLVKSRKTENPSRLLKKWLPQQKGVECCKSSSQNTQISGQY